MRFVPESMKEEKPTIEVTREGRVTKSRIKYPEPKRTERDDWEYDFEESQNSEDL